MPGLWKGSKCCRHGRHLLQVEDFKSKGVLVLDGFRLASGFFNDFKLDGLLEDVCQG